MKKSISLIVFVLVFVTSMVWAETVKDKSDMKKEGGEGFKIEKIIQIDEKKEEGEEFKIEKIIHEKGEEEWFHKGVEAFKTNNYEEAIKCFKEAIAINPNYIDAHYNLGITYYDKGMLDEAIVEFNKIIAINPDSADVHHNLGHSYFKKGLNSMAADHLYRAGLLHLRSGNEKWALQAYEDLKLTNSKELEQKLYEKLHPDQKQKKSQDSN